VARVQLFLSTVSAEFLSYRDRLRHLLTRPNVEVKVQEDFIVTGNETLEMLDTYIQGCDGVIHLVGDMTGAMAKPQSLAAIASRYPELASRLPLGEFLQADGPSLSYTQWEALLALHHGKPLFIATPTSEAPRDRGHVRENSQQELQRAHLNRLREVGRYPGTVFTSQEHLGAEVLRSFVLDLLVKGQLSVSPYFSFSDYLGIPKTARSREQEQIRGSMFLDSFMPGRRQPWSVLPPQLMRLGRSSGVQDQCRAKIYRELKSQLRDSPLRYASYLQNSEHRCREIFPKITYSLPDIELQFNQPIWSGLQDPVVVSSLRDYLACPIRISVHCMMVATVATLLSLKHLRHIPIEIDWLSGCSPEQLHRISTTDTRYDFLFTADAGIHFSEDMVPVEYSRLLTCNEETQYIIGSATALTHGPSLAYIMLGTTQQIHYDLWLNENRLPRDKAEITSISDIPLVAEQLSGREVLILTRPKSQRIIKTRNLKVIGMEKRGLSFGFYHHQSWIDQSVKLTDFMKIFVTEWNYLRSALCNRKVADPRLEYLLKHLLHDTSFLNAFSVASDFNLINHSLPVD